MAFLLCAALAAAACGTSSTGADARIDSGLGSLPFSPSNINLSGIDLSRLTDEDVSVNCEIRTVEGGNQSCFRNTGDKTMVQSDGSKIHVIVVKSLRVEPNTHLTLSVTGGTLPIAIVSLGDFTVLGTIDAHGASLTPGPGGFVGQSNHDGAGPGGGGGATGVTHTKGAGAGGGSYCGQGGQGGVETGAAGVAAPKTAAYGAPTLVPLAGGSGGGGGDIGGGGGGGGVQLVAGGTFTLGAGAYVNVGGGGGVGGGTTGQEAGGGGSGGSLLIEAMTIKIAGVLAANGGGGGGGSTAANNGTDAAASATPAAGGTGGNPGGAGGSGATADGVSATSAIDGSAAGGGGAAGRIRLNSKSGVADLTGATLSPAASTSCVSQGTTK